MNTPTPETSEAIKLWNAPRGCRIYCVTSDGSTYVTFHHLDGMYSLCTTEKGAFCHLSGATLLAPVHEEPGSFSILLEEET